MPSTSLAFASAAEHRAWLATQARLPAGFRVGTSSAAFTPVEVPKPARMNVALIALARPTPSFAAKLTTNAFPGAPILVARFGSIMPAPFAMPTIEPRSTSARRTLG